MNFDKAAVLQEILEQSLAGYWDWDILTGEEYLSPSFKKMFGYEEHEVENKASAWQKLVLEEDLPLVLKTFKQHAESRGKIPYINEIRYHHKDGSTVWVICTGRIIEWTPDGKPKRMVGCHIDITERKIIEQQLLDSKQRLDLAMAVKNEGIWDWNLVTNETYFDERYYLMAGYSPNEFPQNFTAWAEHLHPDDLEKANQAIQNYLQGKTGIFDTGFRFKRKDGTWMWIQGRGKIVERSPEGIPLRIVGTHTDITEQRMAEEALKESEASLQKQYNLMEVLLDNLTSGVFMVEAPRGRPLIANRVAKEILGRGILPDVTRENLGEIYKAHKLGEAKTYPVEEMPIIRGMHGETAKVYDMVIEKPDGKETLLEVSGTPVRNEQGDVWASLVNFQDITERKHTEDVLSNALKLEALGVLAGGIAHDFNNLMGGIFGFIEQARDISTEPQVIQTLDQVIKNIDRARSLTQQLLTFAKGGCPLQEVAPFFPFIEQTVKFALSGSNVVCSFDIDKNLWSANYDKNQIGQVIDNLVINALQAMPAGGRIIIKARNTKFSKEGHPVLPQGDYVMISVTDTGPGIPKELQPRIFDPFFSTKPKGHGLGLATCHSIIKRHEGAIEVCSEPGKGTSFTIYLPAVKSITSEPLPEKNISHRGSGIFLVMDDEEVMRAILSAMLESLGYEVICTANGQEAIDFMSQSIKEKKDVAGMLFDLTVPGGIGGRSAVEQIRNMGITVPAFVASGYADDPIIRNPVIYGFSDSICKPFMKTELIEMLEKHMRKLEGNR